MRRVVQELLDHQAGDLEDDATILMVEWHGPPVPVLGTSSPAPPGAAHFTRNETACTHACHNIASGIEPALATKNRSS